MGIKPENFRQVTRHSKEVFRSFQTADDDYDGFAGMLHLAIYLGIHRQRYINTNLVVRQHHLLDFLGTGLPYGHFSTTSPLLSHKSRPNDKIENGGSGHEASNIVSG